MSLVSGPTAPYIGTDQILVDQIVYELKSQGIFDSFRKECIADVDTKPAYQNLRQRVEGSVGSFLKEQKWKPESNKNQLREMLRKNIYESGFLETGVERIVNQVVNPKINTVFLSKVKEVFYKYIGLQTPATVENLLTVDTISVMGYKTEPEMESETTAEELIPTDLEAVSPENANGHVNDNNEATLDSNSMPIDDDDTSPPFEPIDEDLSFKLIPVEEDSIDSHLSGISGLASHDSQQSNKDNTVAMQQLLESDSQISKNSSSDDRLSIVTDEASNMKVDMLIVNDGVVVAMEIDGNKDINVMNMDLMYDNSQCTNVKEALNKVNDLEEHKITEESSVLTKNDLVLEEDSKTFSTLSSESSDGITKHNSGDCASKSSSHKKDISRDHKSSRHHSSSKSRDKSRDSKEHRESKEKTSKSKSSSSSSTKDRDKDDKNKNSSSSRHSSDKDKDRSSSKKQSSSSFKDNDKSSTSNTKDRSKDNEGTKDKESGTSNKSKSSKDYSSSKSSSTSSSRDKSTSKDRNKDSKSKGSSSDKHHSSSSRKYSTSSTSRTDSSKPYSSSNTSKVKRDKKDSSIKDDHFSSKPQHNERRSTDRDSNDGQTRNKGTANDATTLLPRCDQQKNNNNTTEDCSSSNSKDSANSDCCHAGDDMTVVSDKIKVDGDTDNAIGNLQPALVLALMTENNEGSKILPSSEDHWEQNTTFPLPSPSIVTASTAFASVVSNSPEFVETLDAIKSHIADYKPDERKRSDKFPKIKLPKFASNFREARKIMKLRKQLKQQNKLRKLITKENITDSEIADQVNIREVTGKENNRVAIDNEAPNENINDNSLLLLEQDLSNDATFTSHDERMDSTTENSKIDIVYEKSIKANNDDCLYLDKVTDKTTRYLSCTASFIKKLGKDISELQNKVTVSVIKHKRQKRKISTISSDSSTFNDSIADVASNSSKLTCNFTPPPSVQAAPAGDDSVAAAAKIDVVAAHIEDNTANVTSATAHVQVVKQRRLNNIKATQRYTSDDLYKPRPFLKGTTKRTSGRVAN